MAINVSHLPVPNTEAWFQAIGKINKLQEQVARELVRRAGVNCCSVCGDDGHERAVRREDGSAFCVSICTDCEEIQRAWYKTIFDDADRKVL